VNDNEAIMIDLNDFSPETLNICLASPLVMSALGGVV
jgi:hypothetical protein